MNNRKIVPLMIRFKSRVMTPGFHKLLILMMIVNLYSSGQNIAFHEMNSGTKADIQSLLQDKQQEVFFLTDKIYKLKDTLWEKLDFPVEGKITNFYPVSEEDIWIAINQVTSTSLLYHFHRGIMENVRLPFANQISSIYFISKDSALFASFSDVAVYENGSFRMLKPSPTRYVTKKIYSKDLSVFWALTSFKELIFYNRGKYERILENRKVTDFCFRDTRDGYILSEDALYRVDGKGIEAIYYEPAFQFVRTIGMLNDGSVLMAGDTGLIMNYSNGHLTHYDIQCQENLTDLVSDKSGNILISGENGILLYSGKLRFSDYKEDLPGFSSHVLISYGIAIDDEYGVAMADFNNDDKTDIYAVRIYEQNRLYINNIETDSPRLPVFGFSEEAVRRNAQGVLNPEKSNAQGELKLGIAIADIDNDNDQDIYLCYLNSTNKLLLNKGDGFFRNVSEQDDRACENMNRSNAAAFADVDNDGDLDLFVANEEGSNRLFSNNGTGSFTDITSTSGLESAGGGMCASFSDINNDGLPDLCVTFWYPSNKLYINESGNGKIFFRDITYLTDIAEAASAKSNGVAFADVNNDGFPDLFIASRNAANKLYLNNGKGLFIDKTSEYFQPENYLTNGAVFADFDLDGYQDLYISNVGENVLYKNIEGKHFKDITAAFGAEMTGYCTGSAAGDVDNDGDPDLYIGNYINGNSQLFRNNTGNKSFVKFKLHGVRSNKDAIGSKVWLYEYAEGQKPGTLAGYRELKAGEGYGSTSAKEMIFGVRPGAGHYALIKFPCSPDTLRIEHISAGSIYAISELKGFQAFRVEAENRIVRFFTDRELLPEIIKGILIILFLLLYNLFQQGATRKITLTRWLVSGFIFLIFLFINRIFLFQGLSFSFFIAPVIAIVLVAILHLLISRILVRRQAQREILELREKLSRDLHDDLASTLGSISIYAGTLQRMNEPSSPDYKKLLDNVSRLTQAALQSISDIIWMTSPRNDTLQSLISKTSNYMLEILTDNRIEYLTVIEIPDEPVILEEEIRNDTFLILKEALNNTIRHSGAAKVFFNARLAEDNCTITFRDNGIGIGDPVLSGQGSHGNGLINMRKRAQGCGISFSINSAKDFGTEIKLQFKI